jgi:TonB family protein
MFVYGLRLLVALITFGVGVTASWLTSSGCPKRPAKSFQTTEQVLVFQRHAESTTHSGKRECKSGVSMAKHGEADLVEGGILNGKAQRLPAPVYPPLAKSVNVRGTVYVRVVVDESGRVASAHVAGGPVMLQQAALDAAREALFAPTLLSGQPVRVGGVLTYNFPSR